MSLFEGIGFENFRVFGKQTNFQFAPITILTGTNNSGKSSLLNGIKLLQENFRGVKNTWKPLTDIDLQGIMETKLETGTMMPRYGNLQQFIPKGSVQNEFSFSFMKQMQSIDDKVKITFNVKISDDNIKNGFVTKISMFSENLDKIIFQIIDRNNENDKKVSLAEQYKINLDFSYFFYEATKKINDSRAFYKEGNVLNLYLKEMKEGVLTSEKVEEFLVDFNRKHNVTYSLELIEDQYTILNSGNDNPFPFLPLTQLKSILKENDEHIFLIDFKKLWCDNDDVKLIFENDLITFYHTTLGDAYMRLNVDIIKFLTDVDWVLPYKGYYFDSGIKLILSNEFYSHLSEISPIKILNFKDQFGADIFGDENIVSRLFFVEDCDESGLEKKHGCYFISNATLLEKWQIFLSDKDENELLIKSSPLSSEKGVFRSWSNLKLFKHKIKNILLFDLYVMGNKKNQSINKNILPCIQELIQNNSVQDLTIVTKQLPGNTQKKDNINLWLEQDLTISAAFFKSLPIKTISFLKYDDNKASNTDSEHNRFLLTNYFFIRLEAGFNIFKDNGKVNHRDSIKFDSLLKNSTRRIATEALKNLRGYAANLRQTDTIALRPGELISHFYFYPAITSKFLKFIE